MEKGNKNFIFVLQGKKKLENIALDCHLCETHFKAYVKQGKQCTYFAI
jgi:hypothetical protein